MNNIYVRAFIAGSSFPVILIPFLYLGISITLNPESGFNFFYEAISVPILFGIFNIVFITIKESLPNVGIDKYLLFGIVHGIVFSFLGNFWLGVPEKLFLLSGWMQYLTIPAAMIVYGVIWKYIVKPINIMVKIEK